MVRVNERFELCGLEQIPPFFWVLVCLVKWESDFLWALGNPCLEVEEGQLEGRAARGTYIHSHLCWLVQRSPLLSQRKWAGLGTGPVK